MAQIDEQVENLKSRGVALPRNSARAKLEAHSMHRMAAKSGDLGETVGAMEEVARIRSENSALTSAMGSKRANSQRFATGGGDAYAAIPRFYDPIEFWDITGLPWNMEDEGHRHKLHKWLRLYYATHYLVPILVDIFTRFPLVGMEFECKDKAIKRFHEDHFFDQLNYPEFFVQLGREFWVVGEAFPLASFDEDLGVFEREELLNPEDIQIKNFPLLGTRQFKIKPPDYLKKLAREEAPAKEFRQLEVNFPELIPYLKRGDKIPVSDVLLKQVANINNPWDDHGTPILLRGLRTLHHEEKLTAAQDAIAERLYSPLILAKLGIEDLGDNMGPWLPGPEEQEQVRDDLDVALASDFRLMVHHFGLDISIPFGREQMPRLGDDFDRIERRLMQVFGVNPSLLSAGSGSQPYASSALQAEFLNQILRTFQNYLKRHYMSRALIVAEAQEHQDYEQRGQTRIPITEEVRVEDPSGENHYETRPKWLIPDLKFQTLDLRDEATQRQFLQTLRTMGVPIPDQKLMVGIPADIVDWTTEYNDELARKTIGQQEAKMRTYKSLHERNLPIPPDLRMEVEQVLGQMAGGQGGLPAPPGGGPMGGAGGPTGSPGESIVMPAPPGGMGAPGIMGPGEGVPGGGPPPAGGIGPGPPGTVPDVSNERRPGMAMGMPRATRTAPLAHLSRVEVSGLIDDWFNQDMNRTSGLEWEPGLVGKGAFDENGVVHTWNIRHHWPSPPDVNVQQGFTIGADGTLLEVTDPAKAKLVSQADPRIKIRGAPSHVSMEKWAATRPEDYEAVEVPSPDRPEFATIFGAKAKGRVERVEETDDDGNPVIIERPIWKNAKPIPLVEPYEEHYGIESSQKLVHDPPSSNGSGGEPEDS